MKNNIKKWTLIAGVGIICILLIAVIASQFKPKPVADDLSTQQQAETDVNPSANENGIIIVPNEDTQPNDSGGSNGAVSTGTEQTIQADPVKPAEPSESQKTNPNQKPNGEKVVGSPVAEDHDSVTPPTTAAKPNEPAGGSKNDKGEIYVPGFGWRKPTGGSGEVVDSPGDINKQVGTMD